MTDESLTIDDVLTQLADRRADAVSTLEHLDVLKAKVEEERAALENPQAVLEYLAFFKDFVGRAVADVDAVAAALPTGALPAHAALLRQVASNSSAEQRRCLLFRDKIINKPLPHERTRPLLNDVSVTTRDQLTAFRDYIRAADRIDRLLAASPPPPEPPRVLDRRALFSRLLRRDGGSSSEE